MRLFYTSTAYPPSIGGAQLTQHVLVRELARRHDVQVASLWSENRTDWLLGTTLRAPEVERDEVVDGVPVRWLGLDRRAKRRMAPAVVAYYPLMTLAAPRIAQELVPHLRDAMGEADLVHNVRIGREPLSLASFSLARERDVPFVLTPIHHPRWRGWRYRVYNDLYRRADLLIALTEAEKSTLCGFGVDERKVAVTGVGPILARSADAERFRRKLGVEGPMVLFLGQHFRYKGWRELLEAAPRVWKRSAEATFVFAGPAVGRSESVFRSIQDRRIRRVGTLDLQAKTDALAACDVLCLPSLQESFGSVILEAWSFCKPVVACRIPAVAEVVRDGADGLLVIQTAEAIADAVSQLLAEPARARELGQAGNDKLARKYSWPRLAERTEQAYDAVRSGLRS